MARCQTQTDTKPIAICSEILPFLCTYTLPHMHVQLRLNFSSRALLKSCCLPLALPGVLGWEPQTDTKPIAICSEILPFLCTYTLPHMHVQLRLNFSSRALLKSCCVSCSKINCSQFCSSMDFCFREVLGRESLGEKLVIWADRYKTDTRPI